MDWSKVSRTFDGHKAVWVNRDQVQDFVTLERLVPFHVLSSYGNIEEQFFFPTRSSFEDFLDWHRTCGWPSNKTWLMTRLGYEHNLLDHWAKDKALGQLAERIETAADMNLPMLQDLVERHRLIVFDHLWWLAMNEQKVKESNK